MNTKKLTVSALFAALCAVFSQIVIPVGISPVPINPALVAVILSGGLLGTKYATLSQCVYLLAGLVGMPVFAGFRGGIGVLAEPGGGFVVGYVAAAWICGLIADKKITRTPVRLLIMLAAVAVCYLCGCIQFSLVTSAPFAPTFAACILPFIPADMLKIALALILLARLNKATYLNTSI